MAADKTLLANIGRDILAYSQYETKTRHWKPVHMEFATSLANRRVGQTVSLFSFSNYHPQRGTILRICLQAHKVLSERLLEWSQLNWNRAVSIPWVN
jgi:hypothetical protein